jgi:hypothetical protein
MKLQIINLAHEQIPGIKTPVTSLSFRPFLDYIRARMDGTDAIKKEIYQMILQKFAKYPELEGEVKLEDAGKYREILDLLHIALSTVVEDEKKLLWGISVPVTPVIFYGSDPLYEFMLEASTQAVNREIFADPETLHRQKCAMLYSFLLNKFYNFNFTNKREIIRPIFDKESRVVRYFRINVDTRFVEVTPQRQLPDLNLEALNLHLNEDEGLDTLQNLLPFDFFRFSGFSIVTITDITSEYAVEKIKDILVNTHAKTYEETYLSVVESLKAMAGSNDLEFGILPLFRVNNKLVEDIDAYCHSVIFSRCKQQGISENFFLPLIEKFVSNPHLIYFRDLDTAGPSHLQIGKLLEVEGIKSYALLPVYFNKELVGSFEIYTKQKGVLDERVFTKIEPAIPLISQLMQNSIEEFNSSINNTIRDKFTSLQASVQWKFNEAAWEYLYRTKKGGKPSDIQKIEFRQVYPLYGAVDMRNSTSERNKALLNDLQFQFNHLHGVLTELKEKSGFGLIEEFIFKCNKWLKIFRGPVTPNDEIRLNQYLNEEAHPFLEHFKEINPSLAPVINGYFEIIKQGEGKAWQNRRDLEESMQIINTAINNYLDMMNWELQRAYPCYFERLRTDGVEYDIYIGQSISPEKPFDLVYVKNLRLWQLSSMAAIAKLSASLVPQMKVPLVTTQLIFIYSNTIDISFRNDERRFDVEGGYNIRYHIIKKRIDKVNIRNSRERLTQPGKIALIYFNQKEADEYVSYIHHLQEKRILNDDLEYLELEELQGVNGLKALRVGVNVQEETAAENATNFEPSQLTVGLEGIENLSP